MRSEPDETPPNAQTVLAVLQDATAELFDRIDALKALPNLLTVDEGEHAALPNALEALIAAASDEDEQEYLLRTAGTVVGQLWCRSGTYDMRVLKQLSWDSKKALHAVLGEHRPELIPDTPERRVCRLHLERLAAIQAGTLTDRPHEDKFLFNGVVDGHPFRLKVRIKSGDIKLQIKLVGSPGELVLSYSPLPPEAPRKTDDWQDSRPNHALSPTVTLEDPNDAALALLAALPEALRDEVAEVMEDCGVEELQVGQKLHLAYLVDIHNLDDPDEALEPDEEAYDLTTKIPSALAMASRLASALEAIAPARPLDEVVQCPYCGTRAYLTADLKCTNCGAAVL